MGKTDNTFRNIVYESPEELAFLQWAFELVDTGYIYSIERAESYMLSSGLQAAYLHEMKTKSVTKQQRLLHEHYYTPEFEIRWSVQMLDKLVWCPGHETKFNVPFIGIYNQRKDEITTLIEVKPVWDQNNMERLFKINQKWMWEKYRLFVNLVKPQKLFPATFTPAAYCITPKTNKPRLIKWDVVTISEFLNTNK